MDGRIFLFLFVTCVTSLPQGVFIGKDGTVGASFGGYSASAGLGGIVGNGGTKGNLHAEAGTPHGHYAAAGLGGSLSENSGSNGHLYSNAGHVNRIGGGQPSPPAAQSNSQGFPNGGGVNYGNTRPQGSGTFDDIFNIPIAALGAVNKYLNNRHRGGTVQVTQKSSGVPSENVANGGPTEGSNTKYDDIFNIPVSVLNSVNRFLNG